MGLKLEELESGITPALCSKKHTAAQPLRQMSTWRFNGHQTQMASTGWPQYFSLGETHTREQYWSLCQVGTAKRLAINLHFSALYLYLCSQLLSLSHLLSQLQSMSPKQLQIQALAIA